MAGSIIAKGNVKYKLEYMKNKERFYRTITCSTYNEAEVYLAAFITEITLTVCWWGTGTIPVSKNLTRFSINNIK